MEEIIQKKIERLYFEIDISEEYIDDLLDQIRRSAELGKEKLIIELVEKMKHKRDEIYERESQIWILKCVLQEEKRKA